MKKLTLAALCLALVSLVPARADDAPQSPSDLAEIARGYAMAFRHLVQAHAVLYYKVDRKTYTISNILSLDAAGAVLIVKFAPDDHLVISANAVLLMTDSSAIPPPSP